MSMGLRQKRSIFAYWVKLMKLNHWDIDFMVAKDGEMPGDQGDAQGAAWRSDQYDEAAIIVNGSIEDDDFEAVLLHELIHVLCRDLDRFVDRILETLPDDVAAAHATHYTHTSENLTQRLALILKAARDA